MLNVKTCCILFHKLPDIRWLLLRSAAKAFFFVFFILCFHQVNAQTASITVTPINGNFCAPAPIQFNATFSETPLAYYWNFGIENDESEVSAPIYTYTTPGSYKVTLTVLFENTIQEVVRVVSVFGPPDIKITPDKDYLCLPGDVNFSISSDVNLTNVFWDFGDGFTAQTSGLQGILHNYAGLGNNSVTVTSTDVRGCVGSASTQVVIQKPPAILSDTALSGCIPVDVKFSANVQVPSGTSVTSYVWNFGDGSPEITTSGNSANHTYISTDTFKAKLTITTSEGCVNSYNFRDLTIGSRPDSVKISTLKDTICASEIPVFFAEESGARSFQWEISDGYETVTNLNSLSYEFHTLGTFKIKVTPVNYGCKGPADSLDIFVRGVIANFRAANLCTNRSFFDFRNTSVGTVNSFRWYFNDTIVGATTSRPTHQFPDQGTFPVTLIVFQNATGCADTITQNIYTARPTLLPADSFVCRGTTVTMQVLNNYANPRTQFNWQLAGRTVNRSSDSTLSLVANNGGIFTNRVIIDNGTGYCRDTLTQPASMRVAGPLAGMSFNTAICSSDSLKIQNLTFPFFNYDPVTTWEWTFGNGTSSDLANPPDIKYATSGNYRITLKATDINGCADSVQRIARVRRLPLLRVVPPGQKVCQGQNIELHALHRSSIQWTPANLVSCDTCSMVTVTPQRPTTYTVVATDTFGCTATQSVPFDVWYDFTVDPNAIKDTSICIGKSVPFDLKVNDKVINWSPATGLSGTTIPNPVATPLVTTTYVANISDSGNCFIKTLQSTVEVNPLPVMDLGPDLVLPYDAPFTIQPFYSNDIVSYRWQPANLLSCGNCPEPSGRATVSTTFTLTTVTNKGCTATGNIMLTIDCSDTNLQMANAFTPNNDGLNDYYYPLTRGISEIKRFAIYNRLGQLIFERRNFRPNDRTLGWDGTINGKPQPASGFVYVVEAVCDLGDALSKKGNFVLIR